MVVIVSIWRLHQFIASRNFTKNLNATNILLIIENNVKFYVLKFFLRSVEIHVHHLEKNKVEDKGTGKLIHIPYLIELICLAGEKQDIYWFISWIVWAYQVIWIIWEDQVNMKTSATVCAFNYEVVIRNALRSTKRNNQKTVFGIFSN